MNITLMAQRPLILVTNDDGITAPGVRTLIRVMNEIGDVVVVAPDSPQSGMGHALTINDTLHCDRVTIDEGPQVEYSCSRTPADCVKMAINELMDANLIFVFPGSITAPTPLSMLFILER